ncbi:uncharacterized protein LOC111022474 [Momordica charantia]|uniref:Uncharacterized protein LOC111022474 n=1 Tax=Momordica charantia TaxID=3673 RepID=A0A6J1DRF5_MOMCH|nr:uncharacterized protein LOC111022474 [Momordica charantia]
MAFRRNTRAHNYEDPNPRGEGAADLNVPPTVPRGVAPPVPQLAPQGVPQVNPQVALLAEALQVLLDNANGAGGAQGQQPRRAQIQQEEVQFIRDFKRFGPPVFNGVSERPTATEEWVRELEALYVYLGCSDEFKVRGAMFMLRGEAVNWWESVAAAEDHANVPVTWARFKDLLYEYYFPVTVRNEKRAEFLRLTQGSLTVTQYERKFTELSRFGMQYIPTEQLKIDKFIDDLRREIKGLLVLKEPTTYAAAVRCALVMDKCLEEPQSQQRIPATAATQGGTHRARIFALTRGDVEHAEAVVTGTVLVLSMPAYALFDSGSSHSFIASTFVRHADLELESLGFLSSVSTSSGSVLGTSQVVKGGQLSFDGQALDVKLIQLDMQDFDVILGMDWLAANRANIDCSKKEVSFRLPSGQNFIFKGVKAGVPRVVSRRGCKEGCAKH